MCVAGHCVSVFQSITEGTSNALMTSRLVLSALARRFLTLAVLNPHEVFDDLLSARTLQFYVHCLGPLRSAAPQLLARAAVLGLVLLDARAAVVGDAYRSVSPGVLAVLSLLQSPNNG